MNYFMSILFIFSSFIITNVYLFIWLLKRNRSFLDPILFIYYIFFISVFLKSIYICLDYETYVNRYTNVSAYTLLSGLSIIILFTIGYLIGALIPNKKFINNRKKELSISTTKLFWVFIFLISFIIFYGFYLYFSIHDFSIYSFFQKKFMVEEGSSRLEDVSYIYYRMMLFIKYLFFIFLFYTLNIKKNMITTFIILVLFILSAALPLYFGNRAGFILFVLDYILIMLYLKKISMKQLLLFLLIISSIFIVSSMIRKGGNQLNFFDHLFLGRYLIDFNFLHLLIEKFNSIDDLYLGATFFTWIFVPLKVFGLTWSDSFLHLGNILSISLYNEVSNSIPPGIIGELFINFTYIGVLIGGILLSILIQNIFLWYYRTENIYFKFLFPLLIIRVVLFLFNNDFGTTTLKIFFELFILYFLLNILFKIQNKENKYV